MRLPSVVQAEHAGQFRIPLTFNDGTVGIVDVRQWLNGRVFEPLNLIKDQAYFRRFFLDGGTVAWPNGADIAPETLYGAVRATRSNNAPQPAAKRKTQRRG